MRILDIPILRSFIRTCEDGWLQGWHERNGGNLTYRMKATEVEACLSHFQQPLTWTPIGVTAPTLAGEFFITTGSGRYFRKVKQHPSDSIGIVEINERGDSFRVVWGLRSNAKPTGEFPGHFMSHAARTEVTYGKDRVIYHAHTPNLIAMTYILPLDPRDFSKALWRSATECIMVFPDGVGVVPWMVPGSADIAAKTSEAMMKYSAAVWAHHGLFCSGADFDEAFGLMHTIEKAAEVYMKVICSGRETMQTISDGNLREVAEAFGLRINESFFEERQTVT